MPPAPTREPAAVTSARAAVAEAIGAALLVAAVVGSGIMAERLAGGSVGLALLANTLATGGALLALIHALGPVSGAHFNPVVTLWAAWSGALPRARTASYLLAQLGGGVLGVMLANLMFDLDALHLATTRRGGAGQWLGEVVATFGLLGVIIGVSRRSPRKAAASVAGFIVAAYWFTSSTSFANPAVTVARALSDSFAGIRPADVPGFVLAQLVGGALGAALFAWLVPELPAAAAVGQEPR